jgi:hypothetical protein
MVARLAELGVYGLLRALQKFSRKRPMRARISADLLE